MNEAIIQKPTDSPIKVFIGATEVEWLPAKVLEFSVRETSNAPIDITPIYIAGRSFSLPRTKVNRPRTPFSFQRFLVPELCDYQGRAIYLDSDMLVFHDISQLWKCPLCDFDLLTVPDIREGHNSQFSVMLLDCTRLLWNIDDIVNRLDSGIISYDQLMYEMSIVKRIGYNLPIEWNCLESYEPNRTFLLHYTEMNRQPWVSTRNPLAHHWVACLRRSLEKGFIMRSDIEQEILAGHVRPSLANQLDADYDDPMELSAAERIADLTFIASYQKHHLNQSRLITRAYHTLRAFIRRL